MTQTQYRISWSQLILPDLNSPVENYPKTDADATFQELIENVRRVPTENSDFVVPDPKAVRSMTRASLMLSSLSEEMKPYLAHYLSESPFSVGIYCAVENGPIDGPSTLEILNRSGENIDSKFSEAYRKLRNPKMYLKQLPNLAPAQLGIGLGIQGPMNVYTHSKFGSLHAIDQALEDLKNGLVQAALVLTAHAFEDFLVVRRSRSQDLRTLTEGAAAMILTKASENQSAPMAGVGALKNNLVSKESFFQNIQEDSENYFGIANQLINILSHYQKGDLK
jgi:hypothetical protein